MSKKQMSLKQLFSLENEVAIITGAGKGIGRASALLLAEAGAKVVCSARTLEDVESCAAEARALGTEAVALSVDARKEEQLERLVTETRKTFGKLSIVINNVGGSLPNQPLETSEKHLIKDYQFNVATAFNLCRMSVPLMLESNDGGSIVNISSAAARYAQKHFSSYGAAKAALNQLTRQLAADFAPKVRVNAIEPGTIMTAALKSVLDDKGMQSMVNLTPLATLGEPQDIAAAVLYLVAPASKWVTGKILQVDGGAESSTWPY